MNRAIVTKFIGASESKDNTTPATIDFWCWDCGHNHTDYELDLIIYDVWKLYNYPRKIICEGCGKELQIKG